MSRDFGGASGRLDLSEAIITVRPFSVAAWFLKKLTFTSAQTILALNDGTANNFHRLYLTATNLFLAFQSSEGGNTSQAVGTTANTPDVWYHGAATAEAAGLDRVFLNAVQEGTQGTQKVPIGLNTTQVGVRNGTGTHGFSGLIAEVGIWDVVLTVDEIKALAAGETPNRIRPGNLKLYLPIWGEPLAGPEVDHFGQGKVFTVSAEAQALGPHAPVTRYAKQRRPFTSIMPPGGSGTPIPVFQNQYRRSRAS